MKTTPLFLTAFIALESAFGVPEIFVDEKVHSYGALYREDHASAAHTFIVENIGDEDLQIKKVDPSCGCTKAEISRDTIPPGEYAELEVELTFKSQVGGEKIRVSVISNDPENPVLDLSLTGELIRHWYLAPNQVFAGVFTISTTMTQRVTVTSHHPTPEEVKRVLDVKFDNPALSARLLNEPKPLDKGLYWEVRREYEISIGGGADIQEKAFASVFFHTDDPAYPALTLPIHWVVEGDLSVEPRSLELVRSRYHRDDEARNPRSVDTARIEIASRSGAAFTIAEATAPPPFRIYVEEDVPSPRKEIYVSLPGVEPGIYDGLLTFKTAPPHSETRRIPLHGEVEQKASYFTSTTSYHQIGTVFADRVEEVTHTYVIKNGGGKNLELSIVSVDGATGVLSSNLVPPKASAELTVRTNPRGVEGPFDASVLVGTNDPLNPQKVFLIRGTILPRWRLKKDPLPFGTIQPGEEEKRRVILQQFFPSWERPAEVVGAPRDVGLAGVEVGERRVRYEEADYGLAETDLTVSLEADGVAGPRSSSVPLSTKEETEFSPPEVTFEWEVRGDLTARPTKILMKPSPLRKEEHLLRISSRAKTPFKVESIEVPDGIDAVEIETGATEALYRIVTEGTKLAPGNRRLLFRTDRSDHPVVKVDLLIREP